MTRSEQGSRNASPTRSVVLAAAIIVLVVLVLLPVLFLIYGAFRTNAPGLPNGMFTLNNFAFLGTSEVLVAILNTAIVGVGSTIVAVLIGLGLAIVIARTDVAGRRALNAMVTIPAYMAPVIGAIAWTLLLSPQIGYLNKAITALGGHPINIYSIGGMIWVTGLYLAPVAYLYIRPALINLDPSMEEAARVHGSNAFAVLRKVVLPLVLPAILSSTLVVFVASISQFGIPGVLGNQVGVNVVSTLIVSKINTFPSDPNGASMLGIALAIVTVIGLYVSNRIMKGRSYVTVGQRGSNQARTSLGRWRIVVSIICFLYVLLAVVLPIGATVIGSLQPYLSPTQWSVGWTLSNYTYVFTNPADQTAIINSVTLAIGAAIFATILAILLGYIISRTNTRWNRVVEQIASAPLAIPHAVFGLALVWLWISVPGAGIYGTKWILLFAYTAMFFPYALRASLGAFGQIDASLEEAGRVMGGGWLHVLRRVVVPLLRPGLISGAVIVLYYSIRELEASIILAPSGSNTVMAVQIWNLYGYGSFTQLFALAIVNLVIVFALVTLVNTRGRSLAR